METTIWAWVLFNAFVLALLALDLGVFHRNAHAVSLKEAGIWSVVWVGLALAFNAGIWWYAGSKPAISFLTGYLIEKSLAVDNIFVFVLLFGAFAVPAAYQHRVLFWGILGALLMRGALIGLGAYLIGRFHWVLYAFGAFLIVTGIRMALEREKTVNVERNGVLRLLRRLVPITDGYRGAHFLTREGGRLLATPLLVVLVLIEVSDLIFAVDSIPAIFAVTQEPFLVYTSNVFAILGLRSMYFLLAGVVERFHLLKLGLAAILAFVGVKMLVADLYQLPSVAALGVVLAILAGSVVASLIWPKAATEEFRHSPVRDEARLAEATVSDDDGAVAYRGGRR